MCMYCPKPHEGIEGLVHSRFGSQLTPRLRKLTGWVINVASESKYCMNSSNICFTEQKRTTFFEAVFEGSVCHMILEKHRWNYSLLHVKDMQLLEHLTPVQYQFVHSKLIQLYTYQQQLGITSKTR